LKKKELDHDSSSSSTTEQNIILNLLTTPKYRAMSVMYIIFRLLDNISLLSIIVLSIIHNGLTTPTLANISLFSAIGLEIFYDVMLQVNKYWILERLSVYIGIILYVIYTGIVAWKNFRGEYTPEDLQLVAIILSIRFCAFLFEEGVDIAIDGELHNDLTELNNKPKQLKNLKSNQEDEKKEEEKKEEEKKDKKNDNEKSNGDYNNKIIDKIRRYTSVSLNVDMPDNVKYRGSFFAWSAYSVFNENVWNNNPFPHWLVILLCALPACIAILFTIGLFILCFFASIIPILTYYFIFVIVYCTCNPMTIISKGIISNFWKELSHF